MTAPIGIYLETFAVEVLYFSENMYAVKIPQKWVIFNEAIEFEEAAKRKRIPKPEMETEMETETKSQD